MNIIGRAVVLLPYNGKNPIEELGTDIGTVTGYEFFNGERYYEVVLSTGEQIYIEPNYCKLFDLNEYKKIQ